MIRLLVLLAVLCALASVLGSAVTGALAADVETGSFSVGVSQTVASCETGDHEKAPVFRPCGKMKNGTAVPCSADQAVIPTPFDVAFPLALARRYAAVSAGRRRGPRGGGGRPPRAGGGRGGGGRRR